MNLQLIKEFCLINLVFATILKIIMKTLQQQHNVSYVKQTLDIIALLAKQEQIIRIVLIVILHLI